jgi:hypothetical protein
VNNNQQYIHAINLMGEQQIPIYFQSWYLDANCGSDGWLGLIYLHNGSPIAIMPYYKRRKWGLPLIDMPHFTKYMGPWILGPYRTLKWEAKIFKFFADQLPKVVFFRQNFHPVVKNWLPFYWEGFSQSTAYTYRLNKQSKEELWEGMNRNMRRNIESALNHGIAIQESEDLAGFYNLNELSFKRQGLQIPYTYENLVRHDQALSLREKRKIFLANHPDGTPLAAGYLMIDSDTVYYHLSGEDAQYRSEGAGILVLWNAILWAFSRKEIKYFDFEGSMIKGVETIRRQFGAYQVPYFKMRKFYFSWIELLTRG